MQNVQNYILSYFLSLIDISDMNVNILKKLRLSRRIKLSHLFSHILTKFQTLTLSALYNIE